MSDINYFLKEYIRKITSDNQLKFPVVVLFSFKFTKEGK